MTQLVWDQTGKRLYETGVSRGVLYLPNGGGVYDTGYAWNGLTTVTEKPSGAAATAKYADNVKYLNLISIEEFLCSIEAYTYPEQWAQCDGSQSPTPGVSIGQQPRATFGLSYRTEQGNDLEATAYGYKLHLVYGALAAPTQKAFATINDTPDALLFAWEVTTTPIDVPGYKPTATMVIDSTKVDADALATLEGFLYGTTGTNPSLPSPEAVVAIFSGTVTQVTPVEPTYNGTTHVITIPTVTGIDYNIGGIVVTGTVTITENTVVNAYPQVGYVFPDVTDTNWLFTFS